tara:strand:+ start:2607 stop:3287 length:681 start_codon:yes stop_codon:yes gene_type:complete
MSFGIICYRTNKENIEYLMIRRKDTLGYVDFLRGKYNINNDFHIKKLFYEMTCYEINNIINNDYTYLWRKLWNKPNEKCDNRNIDKFNYIKLNKVDIILSSNNDKWVEPEWGFPKGRRNGKENDYECSIREFEEETGYKSENLVIIKNLSFVEEVFTGSNAKSYKHKYYLCKLDMNDTLYEDNFQKTEIGDMKWVDYEGCLKLIREYNYEKKNLLKQINNLLNNNL